MREPSGDVSEKRKKRLEAEKQWKLLKSMAEKTDKSSLEADSPRR